METIATIVTILVALLGAVAYLDRKIEGVRAEVKSDFQRLDDRVFALATGMKPLIEKSQTTETG